MDAVLPSNNRIFSFPLTVVKTPEISPGLTFFPDVLDRLTADGAGSTVW